ncbi:transcriptional regulator [Nocardioides sp. Root1257]|uniref:IclR family transcriptional regulator n=1 Tax=unclassified Nocardioides TaxID=2615069 RepID=UPI0006F34745|nr:MULTISPECIES: IclR family transcriptional regulator [unclassified Nocardioides]KQW47349.1 transcriptional regulator [Nocardioides sp. Root1257]KRC45505.1 transcriptional regulator [Nocardioides sp. Root224]
MKTPPPYAVTSVDHALRIATMLQLEGELTVAEVAERLGVARSTAHRLLAMLVYRDFAVQDERRVYRAGPVLELAAHSGSRTAQLRAAALPHLARLVDLLRESANVGIRTGDTARFIASVECDQALRVGSREGMVFPVGQTTAGMLLLAEDPVDSAGDRELSRIRRQGFAVNQGRSEKGVVAVGVPVRDADGSALAGLSVSMPSVRYDKAELPRLVATLQAAARGIESDLGVSPR